MSSEAARHVAEAQAEVGRLKTHARRSHQADIALSVIILLLLALVIVLLLTR
jgi:hypothetical protein